MDLPTARTMLKKSSSSRSVVFLNLDAAERSVLTWKALATLPGETV